MNRREMLLSLAGGAATSVLGAPARLLAADDQPKTKLGIVLYVLGLRERERRGRGESTVADDPLGFLEYCHTLGAGGIQVPLGVRDEKQTERLRQAAEKFGMFIEGIAGLPQKSADVERFEAQLLTAKRAGANVVRVVIIPGRRYERFDSLDEFQTFAARGVKSLELAEPIAAKHGIRLAVENHKGQLMEERLKVFQRISSEYVGACVDTGNSFALLEDPLEVVEAYAPYAVTVHLKDQAVQEYDDGFLFADVPLGDGFLDLKKMVEVLRSRHPEIHFNLELITRDALKVPCLTDKYWSSFPAVRGDRLARTMKTVRDRAAESLSQVSRLPLAEQVQLEEQNVRKCLAYAREQLKI